MSEFWVAHHFDDANLSCMVVGSDLDWWNRLHYYKNEKARKVVKSELSKMIHNFIAYEVFQKLGLLDNIKENLGTIISFFKRNVYKNFVGTD